MQTIGILGGIGPQATMDLEARIHKAAQAVVPPDGNRGYPPLVVFYLRHPPVLVGEDDLPLTPVRPDPRTLQAARQLGGLVDFLLIGANGPHRLQAEIEAAAGKPVLSMIAVTLDEVQRRGWRKLGVLGLRSPEVYLRPLAEAGLEAVTLPEGLQTRLDQAILTLMEGRDDAEDAAAAEDAVDYLRDQGVDGTILGCTELPLLLGAAADISDLINPAAVLAEAAVRRARETRETG